MKSNYLLNQNSFTVRTQKLKAYENKLKKTILEAIKREGSAQSSLALFLSLVCPGRWFSIRREVTNRDTDT